MAFKQKEAESEDKGVKQASNMFNQGRLLLLLPMEKYEVLFPKFEGIEHAGPACYYASDKSVNFSLGVATLNKAKKLDPSINDACNKAISDGYIRLSLNALNSAIGYSKMLDMVGASAAEISTLNLANAEPYLQKAVKYWGASKSEICAKLVELKKEWVTKKKAAPSTHSYFYGTINELNESIEKKLDALIAKYK